MTKPVVFVEGLRKVYGRTVAVADLSFIVRQGEIFGLLGPNGAGKTTTLECLEGLRHPSAGSLEIMGVDPVRQLRRLRDVIGVQLQTSALPDHIRVEEALRFFAAYHRSEYDPSLLEHFGLEEKRRAQFGGLSTGQKRRLLLALAIAHKPAVIFLDEPTAGLDAAARVALHTTIKDLRTQGATIILSTHDLAEAEALADRVAILIKGKLAALDTPRKLTATGDHLTKVSVQTVKDRLADASVPGVVHQQTREGYRIYYTDDTATTVAAVLAAIKEVGDELVDLRVERPSLQERFLELTEV